MLVKLRLENYIPLMSSGIHKVELDLAHLVNLLISVNGAGKTSVLKEVNPMPPENSRYKNGRKYSEWVFGGRRYILDGYTHQGTGHSFKVIETPDAEPVELNTGGTYTIQKDLVQEHFDLDNNLVKVLAGLRITDRLSAMPANRRKDLFMDVYPNDVDYALGVFNKLRGERNDLKGAIKNQVARYTEENRKLSYINDCGVEQLEERIKGIESELKEALLARGALEGVTVDPDLQLKISQFTQLTDQLVVNRVSGFTHTADEMENAIVTTNSLLAYHQEQAAIHQGVISEQAGYLDGLEEFLDDPDAFKEHAKQINDELGTVDEEIARYTFLLEQQPVFSNGTPTEGLETVAVKFGEYVDRVTVVSDPELTGNQYKQYLTLHESKVTQLRDLNGTLSEMNHKLKHYEGAQVLECPDCTHQFKLGIGKDDIPKLRSSRDGVVSQIEKLEQQLAELTVKIDNDADWYRTMNQLFTYIREQSNVRVLPELVKEFSVGKVYSTTLCNVLKTFMDRAKRKAYRDTLVAEKALLDARLDLLDRNNVLNIAAHVAKTEKALVYENGKISFYKDKLVQQTNTLRSIQSYKTDVNRLRGLREAILVGLGNEGRVNLRGKVDERISELTSNKENYLTSIIKSRSLTAVVQSISTDIDRMKKRLRIVEVWMDGLCPNKGLIGKLMTDFIKAVCGNVNALIKEIWDTPLFMRPCNKENGDLTYKFPVGKGVGEPADDLSECSGGETDIMDWAFRFILLSYKRFPFPLIMDEVGPFLDEIKRERFFNFIQSYTQRTDARQLFLVSHYISQTGVFQDANIVGLKYEGLTIPGEVNQHSLIS